VQIGGTVVLGVGIWLAADKSSFIEFTRIIDKAESVDGVCIFFIQTLIIRNMLTNKYNMAIEMQPNTK